MGSLLAALATIIVTGLAALLALPLFIDWNDYKTQFEMQAAKLVGRPVRIQGNVDLTVLPVPTLNLRGLRIADEFGKFERPFAEVETLNAELSIPPLLSGTIEARSIELDQPIVRLKIDEFGEGTWLSVGPHGLDIPLPVSEVVLDRVDITDGAIEMRRAGQSQAARFDRISGTFAADGLSGPFRFEGTGAIGGGGKDIRLSAVRIKDRPALRLKASLRSLDGVSLYQLDGEIKGLDGPLHYAGPVAARLALDTQAKRAETDKIAEPLPGKAIELRASAKITLEDASLDDINLTLTQDDRPQSVTGSAYASWGIIPKLDFSVEASWLDIDQMLRSASDDARPVPATAIAALPRVFEGWTFRPRQGSITAKIKQAGLGGDVIEGLDFAATHDAQGWQIGTLTARLPGETDIDVKGILPAGETLGFDGDFTLEGKNLSRLLRWSAPTLGVVDTGNVQNFSLSTGVTMRTNQLAFRGASGTLGASAFTGDLVHDYGETSKLLVALESERLDLRKLYDTREGYTAPDGQAGGDQKPLLEVEPYRTSDDWSAQTLPTRKTRLADVLQTVFKADQSNVSLLITQLQLPEFEARDVRTAFRYENGTFDIRELNVASTDGLKVKASGRMTGFDETPDGALRLSIDAPSAQSVTNLARLIGLDSVSRGARSRIEALSPFQLSGSLNAAARDNLISLTLAGNAGGSELSLGGKMRGDVNALGEADVDVNGVIGNADGRRLIAQLAPEVPLDKAASQAGAGFLKVSALGTVNSGLKGQVELRTPQARGEFKGEISQLDQADWHLKGDLDIRASQAATALSMLRLSPGGTPVTGAIDLKASISKEASKLQIANLALKIGGETVQGTVEADLSGERPVANIDINAASIVLPKIAAYLVDWDREDVTAEVSSLRAGLAGTWPNQAFSLNALRAMDATFKLSAPSISVSESVVLNKGQIDVSLKSGRLTLNRLTGDLYGGALTASGDLTALSGRAGFDARIRLQGADLAALTRANGGDELASGTADLDLSVKGEGLSPRGLVSVLSGDGRLSLSKGAFNGLSPSVLQQAANIYLSEEIPDKKSLMARLESDFREGRLPHDGISLPLVVKDGVLRITEAELKQPHYRIEAEGFLDLASLRFDSEWQIAHRGPAEADNTERLPPVRMVFTGPLAELSSVKPRLYADQFERFLTINRMDADMDRLEKLNKERFNPPRPGATQSNRPNSNSGSSAAQDTSDGSTIPSQSLLNAPQPGIDSNGPKPSPTLRDEPITPDPSASSTENTASSWSTGVESSPDAAPSDPWQTEQLTPDLPQGDFESQIREVLRSQETSQQPAYRR